MQAKSLWVLKLQQFIEFGDIELPRVDVHLGAATNHRFTPEAAKGRFWLDLYTA